MNPHTITNENLKIKEPRSGNHLFGVGVKKIIVKLIKLYQKTASLSQFFFGSLSGCRFQPSCSEYSIMAIEKYGFLAGSLRSSLRILKCGPWTRGGVNFP